MRGVGKLAVRGLKPRDLPGLLAYDFAPLITERDTIYLIVSSDHGEVSAVAELDGRVAGFCLGVRSADGRSVFLLQLHVRKELRRGGIGTRLLEELEARARKFGVRRVWLLTTLARSFYEKRGYAPSSDVLDPGSLAYVLSVKRSLVLSKEL